MIFPTKFEKIDNSPLIVGSSVLDLLKKKDCDVESLFQELREQHAFSLDQFLDVLAFLWIADAIELDGYSVVIKR